MAITSIDFGLLATALLQVIRKLRNSKTYAAAHHQTGSKSAERAYLWEPLLRLMKKYHVKPGQHGSFLRAVKSLHLAVGIDAPSEGAVKKMLHDLRQTRSRVGVTGPAKKSPEQPPSDEEQLCG